MNSRGARIHLLVNAFSLAFVAVLLIGAFPWSVAANSPTQLYLGHRARLTAQIPAGWTIPEFSEGDYSGTDGFVVSYALPSDRLDEACNQVSEWTFLQDVTAEEVSWQGEDACRIEGTFDEAPAVGLVISHPRPFSIDDETYAFAVIVTDPDHFGAITDSISFDPRLVTPQRHVDSVLDLIEARAWYSPELDWDRLRSGYEPLIQNAETLEETHWVIKDVLANLGYWGDNHSFFVEDMSLLTATEQQGLGIVLERRVVRIVYPDSPADRAGVKVGDTIQAVDGVGFNGTRPSLIGAHGSVTLQLSRHGEAKAITVEIEAGSFELYLPPIVKQASDEIGYVELFTTGGADRVEYATDANEGIARVDEAGMCGWIVDLRRNAGGGYAAMVGGVGSILGDGPILTWVNREGETLGLVEYRNGHFYQDGTDIATGIAEVPVPTLEVQNPPVAILIGSNTSSAGEDTAIAFEGRSDVRFFGERSGGFTVGNSGYYLFDGAFLALADLAVGDRNGATYVGGIEPDEVIRTDWTVYGTEDDPVIQAATEWLDQQPECGQATPVAATPMATAADSRRLGAVTPVRHAASG